MDGIRKSCLAEDSEDTISRFRGTKISLVEARSTHSRAIIRIVVCGLV